jgi:hypothetical protein
MKISDIGDGVYWLEWGCGCLAIINGKVDKENTAPIFRKLTGLPQNRVSF